MLKLVCFLIYLFSANLLALAPVTIRIVSEEVPPLQYDNKQHPPTGAMVDIVNLLLQEAKLQANIEFYPWARTYQIARSEPNTLIFSMLRDDSREHAFQWVGKIYTLDSYFVRMATRTDISINTIDDAKQYKVGAIRDDLAHTYLQRHHFTEKQNLFLSNAYPTLWKQLYNGRTEVAFTNGKIWRFETKQAGFDPALLSEIYKIPDISTDLYIAASLSTEPAIIKKLQQALANIKADGRHQQILTKWQL
jgi:polar amino acid transport system substrate-binding protein